MPFEPTSTTTFHVRVIDGVFREDPEGSVGLDRRCATYRPSFVIKFEEAD